MDFRLDGLWTWMDLDGLGVSNCFSTHIYIYIYTRVCVCVCPPLDKGFSTATLFNVFPPLSTGRGAVIPSAATA